MVVITQLTSVRLVLFNYLKGVFMETALSVLNYWWFLPIIAAIDGYKLVLKLFGVIIIPDDKIGLVKKKFVLLGANKDLPPGRIIALKGEAGFQADTLSPGLHYG